LILNNIAEDLKEYSKVRVSPSTDTAAAADKQKTLADAE
jgi:hypothetical protein